MRRPASRDVAAWTLLLGVPVAYDVWADRHRPQGTLSSLLRWAARTETRPGRLVLAAGVSLVAGWLIPHLTRLEVPHG